MPQPPVRKKNDGKLSENEVEYILNTTLTPKNRQDHDILSFIEVFVRCKSIRQACEETGIHRSLGHRIRNRKDVSLAIQKLIDRSAIKYGFDASEIFERVREVVDFDPIDMMNPDGTFKSNLHDIDPAARRCLKKLKVKNLYNTIEDMNGMKKKIVVGELIEYEFYDKLKGAELAGKEKDMFKNVTKHEHDMTSNMKNILLETSERVNKVLADKYSDVDIVDYEEVGENK